MVSSLSRTGKFLNNAHDHFMITRHLDDLHMSLIKRDWSNPTQFIEINRFYAINDHCATLGIDARSPGTEGLERFADSLARPFYFKHPTFFKNEMNNVA